MTFYIKKGERYQPVENADIMLAALAIMREIPELADLGLEADRRILMGYLPPKKKEED